MLYCFLDTNIFLQCKDFDQINWHKDIDWGELDSREICLVIAPVVIRELDNFKVDARSTRRQERAKKTLSKLVRLWIDPEQPYVNLREKTFLKIIPEMSVKAKLLSIGYETDNPDNQLLAALLLFMDVNSSETITLLSHDTGIRFRAMELRLKALDVPEAILLPPELDEAEKQVKALQKELASLKSQRPKISIGFRDGNSIKQVIEFQITKFEYSGISDEEIESEIRKKREEIIYQLPNLSPFLLADPFGPSSREITEYNEKCDEYLRKDYASYLRKLYKYKHNLKLTKKLMIAVENKGTIPAEDIDVWLYFPDGFYLDNLVPETPNKPDEPQKPTSSFSRIYQTVLPSPYIYLDNNQSLDEEHKPQIRKTNSYEVEYDYKSLKHNRTWNWPPLWITLTESPQIMPAINIDYKITVANLPEMIEGKLTIKLSSK